MSLVIGIDPSLTRTACCSIEDDGAGSFLCIVTKGALDAPWLKRAERIGDIVEGVYEFVEERQPSMVLIEGPSYSSNDRGAWDRAGLWWSVVDRVGRAGYGFPVVVSPSQRITYALGKGGGKGTDKDSVLAATIRRYTRQNPANNDEADALLLAAMGMRHLGHPIEKSLPQANLAALSKVRWP